jgi:hypothetical protein
MMRSVFFISSGVFFLGEEEIAGDLSGDRDKFCK